MRDLNKEIGERVREARKKAGLSLEDVANAIIPPISLQALAGYERGKHRWPVSILAEVARVLRVPILTLIGDSYAEPIA